LQHSTRKVAEVMESLGFVKRGKDWIHGDIKRLYVEFPGQQGYPEWVHHDVIPVHGVDVHIIAVESLIIDKLGSYSLANPIDGVNVLALLAAKGASLNWDFLVQVATKEGVLSHLEHLRALAAEIDWKSSPPREELERRVSDLRVPGYAGSIGLNSTGEDDHDAET
jgi:hypothetical protein